MTVSVSNTQYVLALESQLQDLRDLVIQYNCELIMSAGCASGKFKPPRCRFQRLEMLLIMTLDLLTLSMLSENTLCMFQGGESVLAS